MIQNQQIRIGILSMTLAFAMLWMGCDQVFDDVNDADTGNNGSTDDTEEPNHTDPDENSHDSGDDFSGRQFQATHITQDGEPLDLEAGTTLVIEFDTDARLSVRAGCNIMAGSYVIEDGVLKTGTLSMTKIGCEAALHEQDDWILAVLGALPLITADVDAITLTSILDDNTTVVILLTDADVLNPPLPLVGTFWTVTTIIDGDVASSANIVDPATFVFGEDGVLVLYTGCNSGGGEYTVQEDTITVGPLAVTERACMDPDIMRIENDVLKVLSSDSLTFEIQKNNLTLSGDDSALGLQGEE